LRPSNPHLTPPTLQIQYCYSLNIVPSRISYGTSLRVQYDLLRRTIFTNIHYVSSCHGNCCNNNNNKMNTKISHSQNNSKFKYSNRKYDKGKINTPHTQIHDRSLSWLQE
jgi:hypothetical protein